MLNIQKITFYNYIPYYREKTFDLGGKRGTTIIFGDNNIGKTSFIKGIKFLFYNFLSKNPDNPNYNIYYNINRKAYEEKIFEFFVHLDFTYMGETYHFTRKYSKKTEIIGDPSSDEDFEHLETIKTDKRFFSQKERKELIQKIIPENISEFVFFDGENIKKYIEILNNDSESGAENRKVKQAINNVIGTPYLDNLISNLGYIKENYYEEHKKNLSLINKDETLRNDIIRLDIELSEKEKSKNDIEDKYLSAQTKYDDIFGKLESIPKNISIYHDLLSSEERLNLENEKLRNFESELRNLIGKSHKPLLYNKLMERKDVIDSNLAITRERLYKNDEIESDLKQLNHLLRSNTCSVCGNNISESKQVDVKLRIIELKNSLTDLGFSIQEKLKFDCDEKTLNDITILLNGISPFSKDDLILKLQQITKSKTLINSYKQSVNDLKKEIEGLSYDQSAIANLIKDRDKQKEIIDEYDRTLSSLDLDINTLKTKIQTKQGKIKGNNDTGLLKKRIKFLDAVINKFIIIKEKFIADMRKKVEEYSSDIFMRFINGINNDIVKVEINENYRMSILTKSGVGIPIPGSGFNTLLALSLIYGLNKNTELFGAIFFDAALSNLSNNYTNNIIKTLSNYAPQLIFLSHKDRIDINTARSLLEGTIANEFEVYQDGDSFNTMIRRC